MWKYMGPQYTFYLGGITGFLTALGMAVVLQSHDSKGEIVE